MKFTPRACGLLAGLILSTLPTFGANTDVACESDPLFGQNNCNVCMTGDTLVVAQDAGRASVKLENLAFDWKNTSDKNQLIYRNEQVTPEIRSTLDIEYSTQDETKFWEFSEEIKWQNYEGGEDEFYLEPAQSAALRKSADKAFITLSAPSINEGEKIMLISPLVYRDYDIDIYETGEKTLSNTCVIHSVGASNGSAGTEVVEDLNAAGEEEVVQEEVGAEVATGSQVEPTELNAASEAMITTEQTKTPTGPEHIVLLGLILVSALAYKIMRKVDAR